MLTKPNLRKMCREEGLDLHQFCDQGPVALAPAKQYESVRLKGIPAIPIVLDLQDDGRILKLIAPQLYCSVPSTLAVFATINAINQIRLGVKTCFDPDSSEIHSVFDLFIEEGDLHSSVLRRAIIRLASAVDEHHQDILAAINNGEIYEAHSPFRGSDLEYKNEFHQQDELRTSLGLLLEQSEN